MGRTTALKKLLKGGWVEHRITRNGRCKKEVADWVEENRQDRGRATATYPKKQEGEGRTGGHEEGRAGLPNSRGEKMSRPQTRQRQPQGLSQGGQMSTVWGQQGLSIRRGRESRLGWRRSRKRPAEEKRGRANTCLVSADWGSSPRVSVGCSLAP